MNDTFVKTGDFNIDKTNFYFQIYDLQLFTFFQAFEKEDVDELYIEVHKDCQATPGLFVPEEIFQQLKLGQNPVLPANFGAHAHCMLNKLDFQDEEGHFLVDEVHDAVSRFYDSLDQVTSIGAECTVNKGTKEENALSLFGCFKKYNIDIGQL